MYPWPSTPYPHYYTSTIVSVPILVLPEPSSSSPAVAIANKQLSFSLPRSRSAKPRGFHSDFYSDRGSQPVLISTNLKSMGVLLQQQHQTEWWLRVLLVVGLCIGLCTVPFLIYGPLQAGGPGDCVQPRNVFAGSFASAPRTKAS